MAQIKEVFFEKFGRILDIFFPRRCEVCGKVNPNGQYGFICDECAKGIYLITGGRCLRCAEIIGPNSAPNATFCHKCLDKPPAFNWGYSCSVFDGAIREFMHGLKYRNAYYLRSDIIRIMKAATPTKHFLENAILIPVPLHHSRKLKRKYNQAEVIAECARTAFPDANITVLNALKRVRKTSTQTQLSREERAENIKDAFAILGNSMRGIRKSARIVIVDDVMTSGATISECARTLKRAGYKNIDAFSFARKL